MDGYHGKNLHKLALPVEVFDIGMFKQYEKFAYLEICLTQEYKSLTWKSCKSHDNEVTSQLLL